MITLRPYQNTLLQQVRAEFATHKRVIMQLPTGGGKTKLFVTMALQSLVKGKTVLILTESAKIYKGIKEEIKQVIEINPDSKIKTIVRNLPFLAMAQTLARRKHLIEQFAAKESELLVIVDECHIGTPTKILEQFTDAYLLGVTATPHFKWAKHLPKLYEVCVTGLQVNELIEVHKALTPYKHVIKKEVDTNGLEIGSNGEFTEQSQERIFDRLNAHELLADDLRKRNWHKGMIFCASIKSANSLYEYLCGQGFDCIVEHSKKGSDLQRFEKGTANLCISVGSMTKGYDFPAIDMVVLWRSTTSLVLYLQMIGRASRLYLGKVFHLCVDWGGNGIRFGRWDEDRDWATLWLPQGRKAELAPLSKVCPSCDKLLHIKVMVCPECGYEFEIREDKPEAAMNVVDIWLEKKSQLHGRKLSTLTANELALYTQIKPDKTKHAVRVAKAQGADFLRDFGIAKGYKRGWEKHHPIGEGKIDFYDSVINF